MELELQKCLKQKGYKVAAIVSGLNGLIGKDTFCFEKKYLNSNSPNGVNIYFPFTPLLIVD